jgi:hypothetical protein
MISDDLLDGARILWQRHVGGEGFDGWLKRHLIGDFGILNVKECF